MPRCLAGWFAVLHLVWPALAQLRIISPPGLLQDLQPGIPDGMIPAATSTFGAPFFGDRVLGRLAYGSSKGDTHCTKEDYDVPTEPKMPGEEGVGSIRFLNIIIVRRGGRCGLSEKVMIAQEKGAHAVVIVDKPESELKNDDMQNVVVNDDGYGSMVHVPSVFVTKDVGDKLIRAVQTSTVVVELQWTLPKDHVVKFDWWLSSASAESFKLLKEFAPKRRALNQVLSFQPHYAVFGVHGGQKLMMSHLCLDQTGELCAEDPDGPGPITGKEVLEEDVRQLCIHEVHKVHRESTYSLKAGVAGALYSEQFWNYIEQFPESCPIDGPSTEKRFGWQCSVALMQRLGIDSPKVIECWRVNTTKFLQQERKQQAWSPRALRINGWRYAGAYDADLITRAICSSFVEEPPECKQLLKPRDPFKPYYVQEGIGFWQLLMWLVGFALGMAVLFAIYKGHLRREMRLSLREEVILEVQAQMSDYAKMGS